MRYSREHKQQTHERILAAAGKIFREQGYTGAGIDSIMDEAGLTPGGFYAHFASKEALLAETIGHALRQTHEHFLKDLEDKEGLDWLRTLADRYLSIRHRDAVAQGCALPTLISELARSGPEPKRAFEGFLRRFLKKFEQKLSTAEGQADTDRALATLAICVGGLVLARAVASPTLSKQILKACRTFAVAETNANP
jgi:TetR/AcrR family transcriptional repressor of nem operon